MEKFEKSELIVAQGENVMQLENLEELESKVFGDKYKDLSKKEKLQQRYKMALPQSIMNNMPIVYSTKGIINKDKTFDSKTAYSLEKSIVIDDETTFILSLCKVDDLRILEREDANIFLTDKERESLTDKEGNYIFINAKVDEIMRNYLQLKKESQEPKTRE